MPDTRRLLRPPLVEASISFQVDASQHWDPAPVRSALHAKWSSSYPEVHEIRPLEFQFIFSPENAPQPVTKVPPLQGFAFQSVTSVLQARRDGFMFTRLAPYTDWESIEASALERWGEFQSILKPKDLHGVNIRFANLLQFELEGFSLANFFAAPPTSPPGLNWKFYRFQQQADYAPPGSPYMVRVTTQPAFVADPRKFVAFMLIIEVFPVEALSAVGRDLELVLAEMHTLKNEAFFNLLTERALQHYM